MFIGIYWQRYGRVSDGMEVSGLEEEFLLSGTEGLPRLLYVKTPRPTASPAWPSCWPVSAPRPHTRRSARQPSWAGWFVTTWRRC